MFDRVLLAVRFEPGSSPAKVLSPPYTHAGGESRDDAGLEDLLGLDQNAFTTAVTRTGVWVQVRESGHRLPPGSGAHILHGSALTLIVLVSSSSASSLSSLSEAGADVLAALDAELGSLSRPAAFRDLHAPSPVFIDFALMLVLLTFAHSPVAPHTRISLTPLEAILGQGGGDGEGSSGLRIVADTLSKLGVTPAVFWRAEEARGLHAGSVSWILFQAEVFDETDDERNDPPLLKFVDALEREGEASARNEPSLLDLSLAEMAIYFGKEDSVQDLVRFFRLAANLGVCRLVHDVQPRDIVVPTPAGLAAYGTGTEEEEEEEDDGAWNAVVEAHDLGTVYVDVCRALVEATLTRYVCVETLTRRVDRRVPSAHVDEDDVVFVVGAMIDAGLLKQVHLVPAIDFFQFFRDCTLSGVGPDTIERLRILQPYFDKTRGRMYTLEELLALVNLRHARSTPLTHQVLVTDLAALDASLSWFVLDTTGELVPATDVVFSSFVFTPSCLCGLR